MAPSNISSPQESSGMKGFATPLPPTQRYIVYLELYRILLFDFFHLFVAAASEKMKSTIVIKIIITESFY